VRVRARARARGGEPGTLRGEFECSAFGIVPGTQVRLIERKPSIVLACGQTSIAVEDEIGREIYVRPAV
jgi:hypothetical protein